MRADTHTHVRNHRERANSLVSISARVCACVHSRRIYSLWHVRVLQPLKTYQSSANRAQLASTLDPAVKTPPRLARDRTGRQDLSIDSRSHREMNFARSIPNYTVFSNQLCFSFCFFAIRFFLTITVSTIAVLFYFNYSFSFHWDCPKQNFLRFN